MLQNVFLMKVAGIILLVAGLVMLLAGGIHFQTKKKVVDAGPIEISKKEDRYMGWPRYAGVATLLAGVVLLVVGASKKK
jgi:uncharacterized membrane protein YdcZ (DUF606 family)